MTVPKILYVQPRS